jgi:16S rRNA processing protein RimM
MEQFLTVGQIINTHGLKGELKIFPLTDDLRRFRKLKSVYIDGTAMNIVWCKLQADKVILKIENIDTIEEAMKYRSKYIEVTREDAVELKEGSFFITDLIGSSVFDETGNSLGIISDVIQTGSNDVYWIKAPKELLIPALKEIVTTIDVENKKIIIKPVELWQ